MLVLVTGGAGFVGAAVVDGLLGGGHDVVVVDRLRGIAHRDAAVAPARPASRTVPVVEADVRDLAAMRTTLTRVDAVVHLAAKVGLGVGLDDMDDFVANNAHGTAVVLRACAAAGIHRFVQASSMVVYGEGRYDCALHGQLAPAPRSMDALRRGEFDPRCPVCRGDLAPGPVGEEATLDPRSPYAVTKVSQEHLASVWARESGGCAISLRLHNVYGPGMPQRTVYAGVASVFSSALDRGQPPQVFEDGGQRRDFIHVNDVASAFVRAVEATDQSTPQRGCNVGTHRAYNVGTGSVSTVGDLAWALSQAHGGPDPVITARFRLGDVRHITACSDRIARELGWRARISLAEGVKSLTFA